MSKVYYTPCNVEHEVSSHGELMPLTITRASINLEGGGKTVIDLDKPVEAYIWIVYDENNLLEDMHCTLNADEFASNQS